MPVRVKLGGATTTSGQPNLLGRRAPAVVIVVVGAIAVAGALVVRHAPETSGLRAPSPAVAEAGLGPGCGLPAVSLVVSGSVATDLGVPVLTTSVGRGITLPISIDAGRPGLTTSAQLVVALPGTAAGAGFVAGAAQTSLSDKSTWLAVAGIQFSSVSTTNSLAFTPAAAGRYPVYIVEHSQALSATPPLCGGVPDKGGDVQALVGWVDAN